MTSYRLLWQHARSTKRPSKFQFLKIIRKTTLVTHRFYFFVGNLPKLFNFLESMTKSYPVDFKIHRKRPLYIVNDTCMQKIKIGHPSKFRDKDNFFPLVLFPVCVILCRIFTSSVLRAQPSIQI